MAPTSPRQPAQRPDTLAPMIELRRLSVDDLSVVRYLHAAAFALAAQGHYTATDIGAFDQFVRSPRYATAVGLLLDGQEQFLRAELARAQGKGLGNVAERMRQWFKANF